MNQVYFVVTLYLLGLLFGLQFKKHIPMPFICLSSFFWGCLYFVFLGVVFVGLGVQYSLPAMGGITFVLAAVLSGLAIKRKLFYFSRTDLFWCGSACLVFILTALFTAHTNYTQVSLDSVDMILRGRALAYDGLNSYTIESFSNRGAMVPVIQSASVLINEGYLSIFQPLLSLSFISTIIFLTFRAIKWTNKWLKLAFVSFTVLAIFSTTMFFYQIFYIHTNFLTAAYLFLGLVSFWKAMVEQNKSWLFFSALAMAGFSLARIETPVMYVVFAMFMLGRRQLTYRDRLAFFLPVCIGLIPWYTKVALVMQVSSSSRTVPADIWAIVAGLTGLAVLILISGVHLIDQYVLPALPIITIFLLSLFLPVAFLLKPQLMEGCLQSIYFNLTISGEWNFTWYIFFGLLIIGIIQAKLPFDSFYTISFMAFFLLMIGWLSSCPGHTEPALTDRLTAC